VDTGWGWTVGTQQCRRLIRATSGRSRPPVRRIADACSLNYTPLPYVIITHVRTGRKCDQTTTVSRDLLDITMCPDAVQCTVVVVNMCGLRGRPTWHSGLEENDMDAILIRFYLNIWSIYSDREPCWVLCRIAAIGLPRRYLLLQT